MAMRLSGIWFKLVEGDGFFLGILLVPKDVADSIEQHGRCRVARAMGLSVMASFELGAMMRPSDAINFIDFTRSYDDRRDAIMMFGCTVSDINKENGFAFVPSADYLGRAYVPPAVETTPIKGNRFQLPAVEFTP